MCAVWLLQVINVLYDNKTIKNMQYIVLREVEGDMLSVIYSRLILSLKTTLQQPSYHTGK